MRELAIAIMRARLCCTADLHTHHRYASGPEREGSRVARARQEATDPFKAFSSFWRPSGKFFRAIEVDAPSSSRMGGLLQENASTTF